MYMYNQISEIFSNNETVKLVRVRLVKRYNIRCKRHNIHSFNKYRKLTILFNYSFYIL